MIIKRVLIAAVALFACLGPICGCRTPGNTEMMDEDLLPADLIDGEYALPTWSDNPGEIVDTVQFETILFEFDSARVSPQEHPKIDAVAQHLKRNSKHRVVLEGHCDERGSREYNIALGERRALAVRTYLIQLGIESERLLTKSYGEERPVTLGHDEQSWRVNRRVEFTVFR